MTEESLAPVELAAELTIAWLGNQNNRVAADEVPAFLRAMHSAILELGSSTSADETSSEVSPSPQYVPAVTARKSLSSRDHIISMIDGKPYKALRRHLSTHGLTDVEYRERYNLRPDYPMVSEAYSEARRAMAHKIGLGRKARTTPDTSESPVKAAAPVAKRAPRKVPAEA